MKNHRLETERLILRAPKIEDAEEMMEYNQPKEFWQYTTIPVVPPTLERVKSFLTMCIEDSKKEPRQLYYFVIVAKSLNKVIGDFRFYIECLNSLKAEFGYGLSPQLHGKGYMTEALKEVIRFGFEDLKLKRISATAYPENKPSAKVMKKCGFKHEGTLRKNALVRGRYFDEMFFSILQSEYENSLKNI